MIILGKEVYHKVLSVNCKEEYRGAQIVKEKASVSFKYYIIPFISTERVIYWKPFKKLITEVALPSLLENNKKGKSPYVNVWFKVAKETNSKNLLDLELLEKINMGSDEHIALEALFNKVQTN